jgi:hypothetical protein
LKGHKGNHVHILTHLPKGQTLGHLQRRWIKSITGKPYRKDVINTRTIARLILKYQHGSGETAEQVRQEIRLTYSQRHYGGWRWWMICPYGGGRCGKLYLPSNGDRFASQKAWRLGYQSQRLAKRDRPFEALFRLQKKRGAVQGWKMGLGLRPKRMWHRTNQRQWDTYYRLDEQCNLAMTSLFLRLGT